MDELICIVGLRERRGGERTGESCGTAVRKSGKKRTDPIDRENMNRRLISESNSKRSNKRRSRTALHILRGPGTSIKKGGTQHSEP